jgi:hypothetical protein
LYYNKHHTSGIPLSPFLSCYGKNETWRITGYKRRPSTYRFYRHRSGRRRAPREEPFANVTPRCYSTTIKSSGTKRLCEHKEERARYTIGIQKICSTTSCWIPIWFGYFGHGPSFFRHVLALFDLIVFQKCTRCFLKETA